jgi:hypothetical protein
MGGIRQRGRRGHQSRARVLARGSGCLTRERLRHDGLREENSEDEHFARVGISFRRLAVRPLQPIDCQNLFCEIDKYPRVVVPHVAGITGRTPIKQGFAAADRPAINAVIVPPKWVATGTAVDVA